jgi:hypothetical protein
MRDRLEEMWRQKKIFFGKFVRFGVKKDIGSKTILLSEIRDENLMLLSDHLWLDAEYFTHLDLCQGDTVQFYGKVELYKKGYKKDGNTVLKYLKPASWDYKIIDISYAKKVIVSYEDINGYQT